MCALAIVYGSLLLCSGSGHIKIVGCGIFNTVYAFPVCLKRPYTISRSSARSSSQKPLALVPTLTENCLQFHRNCHSSDHLIQRPLDFIPHVFNWFQIQVESQPQNGSDVVLMQAVHGDPGRVGGRIVLLEHIAMITREERHNVRS